MTREAAGISPVEGEPRASSLLETEPQSCCRLTPESADFRSEAAMGQAMRLTVAGTVLFLVGVALVGCSEEEPAVCSSVASLETSVDDVKDIDFTEPAAVEELKSGLASIKSDFAEVKSDAKAEFSSQIDAVESSFGALATSVDAAIADPTAAALSAVGAAVSPFTNAVQTLVSDIQSTC
ncbi:hypothetical protein [Aeromicrobium sp.]|uniref:hypothetical protein n=1 Tax=Aeromicrobium sp. TaxID=1871063 RepID=UPI003D6A651F